MSAALSEARTPPRRRSGTEQRARSADPQRRARRVSRLLHVPGRVSSGPDTFMVMAKQGGPRAEDRAEAIRVALSGMAQDLELGELAQRLAPLHPKNNTFPGEVLLELAADAIEEAGATRERPLEFEGIRKRHVPEDRGPHEGPAPQGRVCVAGGGDGPGWVDPALLDEVSWWRTDDLWFWALEALMTYVRAGAEQGGETVPAICGRIAGRHDVQLAATTSLRRPDRSSAAAQNARRPAEERTRI
jgi:hypothetical protein